MRLRSAAIHSSSKKWTNFESGAKMERKPLRNVMMWIGDLKQLRSRPEVNVKTFAVMGVIVDVIAPADLEGSVRPVGYLVDDGTGVIKVSHFMQKQALAARAVDFPEIEELLPGTSQNALMRRAVRELSQNLSAFPIGTCVEAKGRLQEFRGQNELLAFAVRHVEDPMDEVRRMETVARLKREQVYPEELRVGQRPPTAQSEL